MVPVRLAIWWALILVGTVMPLVLGAVALSRRPALLLPMLALLLVVLVLLPRLLLRQVLAPLDGIVQAMRALGERGELPRTRADTAAGELRPLTETLDQLAEQLGERQRTLAGQAEERLTLERRLREAEKFAVIGRLSGGLAHELGSPLSVIAIRAQAIQHTPALPGAAREHAEVIRSQVRRVSDFIQGLLRMAQQQGVVFDPLDLTELLSEVVAELEPRARSEEVELGLQPPAEPVTVYGEKTLLRHALRNLVRNSLHALEEHVGERRVRVRLEVDEQEARVFVEDTGPGIPSAHLAEVFEPFYTTRSPGRGMGLGLPITRGIVEEHGGELHLENLRHSGLRAVMALPLGHRATEPRGPADSRQPATAAPPREASAAR